MSKRRHRLREGPRHAPLPPVIVIAAAFVMLFAAGCNANGSQNVGSGQAQGDRDPASPKTCRRGPNP